jgi:SulP family sulfate permease
MSESKAQTIVAGGTLVATLVLAPHIELGVAIGIALSIGAHLYRELRLEDESSAEGDTLTLRPRGVLWFATANRMEQTLVDKMAAHPETTSLVIDMAGVGRIDYTAAAVLARIVSDAERGGQEVSFINVPLQSDRPLMAHFGHREDVRRGLGRSPDLDPGG